MNAALIAQLVIALGPLAVDFIRKLNELWSKPELTPAEVESILSVVEKSYDDYINAEALKN